MCTHSCLNISQHIFPTLLLNFFSFDCAVSASVNILLHILWLIHEQIIDKIIFCNNLTNNNVLLNRTEYRDLS